MKKQVDSDAELQALIRDRLSPEATAVIVHAIRQQLLRGHHPLTPCDYPTAIRQPVRWFAAQLVKALGGEKGYALALKDGANEKE